MGNTVIIMEFFKEGCAPCQAMMKVLDELENEYSGKITVHKYNVEKHLDLAAAYGVMSVPTIIITVDGQEVYKGRGIHSIDLLRRKIEPYV